ncbi:MAG: adenylate/guanylate cyclase domain-containing protein [Prevotella sp.]|nr:adenylate/guanylate cyclase domain-containing protein [Prevotella sp.]
MGNNYFKNIIYNTYRFPKEEERVFMFIDMVDSTPTADKIGHLKYSRYIQDCFLDFSSILIGFDGEIYQFVGDEVVITWKTSKGFNYQKCMELYFKYIDYLKRKEKFYLKKHNARPMFRCAIHYGTVSTALVGDYKREMAYHGDVLNLCSRLQSACKENNTDMLISDSFYKKIDNCKEYDVNLVLLDDLKGIKKSISAYKVRLKTEST